MSNKCVLKLIALFSCKMFTEEVLLTYSAHWWSKDGARLAYFTINNSATPLMEIPYFLGGVYPSNVFFPYPKVNTDFKIYKLTNNAMCKSSKTVMSSN